MATNQQPDREIAKKMVKALAKVPLSVNRMDLGRLMGISPVTLHSKLSRYSMVLSELIEKGAVSKDGKKLGLKVPLAEALKIADTLNDTYEGKGGTCKHKEATGEKTSDNSPLEQRIKELIEKEVSDKTKLLYDKYKEVYALFTQALADKEYFQNLCKEKQKEIDEFNNNNGFLRKVFGSKE